MLAAWPTELPTAEAVVAFPKLLRGEVVTEENARIVYTVAMWATKTYAFPAEASPGRPPGMMDVRKMNDLDLAAEIGRAEPPKVPEAGAKKSAQTKTAADPFLQHLLADAARRLLPRMAERFAV